MSLPRYDRLWSDRQARNSAAEAEEADMIARRDILIGFGAAVAGGALTPQIVRALGRDPGKRGEALSDAMKRIETEAGGRLGVALLDTESEYRFAWRGGERFAMCSTFKFLLTAAVLKRVDQGQERLDRALPVSKADYVPNSPTVEKHFGGTLSIAALCEATITLSDNAAANLLLPLVGGPAGFTAYLRSVGDRITRLDRIEPLMSENKPGDPRDTTTPEAMLHSLNAVVLGNALQPASRTRLTQWLVENKTGGTRIRAGIPAGWRVGDKTGTSGNGLVGDVAILWPPRRKPLLLTTYFEGGSADNAARHKTLADAARAVVETI
jgi:beta-lactamase class A